MKKIFLGVAGFLALAGFLFPKERVEFYPGMAVVQFRGDVDLPDKIRPDYDGLLKTGFPSLDALSQQLGITGMRRYFYGALRPTPDSPYKTDLSGFYLIFFSTEQDVREVVVRYLENELVEDAFPEYINRIEEVPNDPYYNSQWFLNKIKAQFAWDYTHGDTTILVAIVDTGVDWDHPDLRENIWQNTTGGSSGWGEDWDRDGRTIEYIGGQWQLDPGDLNGQDDDGDGRVDDLIGYDLAGITAGNDPDNNPMEPGAIHGTHVAGCASEVTDNGIGGAGVGWRVRILPVKAMYDNDPNQYISEGYNGIIYAANVAQAHPELKVIINCSWGSSGGGNQSVFNYAHERGCIITCSAGNDHSSALHYPSALNWALSVASTDQGDQLSIWGGGQGSNYGPTIDICAPGDDIRTTWYNNTYYITGGTSMASPITAGALGLIWSFYRDEDDPQVIEQYLFDGVDDIYGVNPDYVGMLGVGRVNVWKAIARGLMPNLNYVSYSLQDSIGDGDGVLNPGEVMWMRVTLQNGEGWAEATGVGAVLSSDDPRIQILDSTASYFNIPGGAVGVNIVDRFKFGILDDAPLGLIPVTLRVSANLGSDYPYTAELDFSLPVTLNQAGWPLDLFTSVEAAPLAVDITDDEGLEIMVGTDDNRFFLWDQWGAPLPGFPFVVEGQVKGGAAVGDVDVDGLDEIVFSSRDRNLYLIEHGYDTVRVLFEASGYLLGTPVLADLDGDSALEVIFASYDDSLFVIRYDGSLFDPAFPYSLGAGARVANGAAVADLDGDDTLDIVVGTWDGSVHAISAAGTPLAGWPFTGAGDKIRSDPSIADLDGDGLLEVMVGSDDGYLYVINHDGTLLFSDSTGNRVRSSPSFVDVDGDGRPEIFFGSDDHNLYGIDAEGSDLPGWPRTAGGRIRSSPVFADLDGDGEPEVVVGSDDGKLYAFKLNGDTLAFFPIPFGGPIRSSPCIEDVDGDGDLEICFGTSSGVGLVDYKSAGTTDQYWNMFRGNSHRTGYYGDVCSTVVSVHPPSPAESEPLPRAFALHQSYPNPFNARTAVAFDLPQRVWVSLKVYNIRGEEVLTLLSGAKPAGRYRVSFDASDLASGIYFCRLNTPSWTMTRKMILIK